ncbi:MAG: gamma carbonic anhydrase family protein [Promethearchaeota archaeon]
MAIFEFEDKKPEIDPSAYISHSADVIGGVVIGPKCFIGPGARIRGDYGEIEIGEGTSIQENCVIHARPGKKTQIGKYVTIGHGAIIHTPTILDHATIGMGAIISDYAEIGEWAIVGEGCVVRSKQVIPNRKIVVGVPAKEIGDVDDKLIDLHTNYKKLYSELGLRYRESLRELTMK